MEGRRRGGGRELSESISSSISSAAVSSKFVLGSRPIVDARLEIEDLRLGVLALASTFFVFVFQF